MMMAPPKVVGVLLKKPGQHGNPRVPPLDPQETKIRGELYVEDLNERRIVSIRMGWLWVENTQMRLPLRALNLRQASPGSICQPHVLALGFTLTNSQGDLLATFWADTEPIYWSWVRAIAAELVRQTPFRAQRCLNFLEILTICPRGPVPLPESPTEIRRRSRSELRCWLGSASLVNTSGHDTAAILDTSRRRARSELRGWSSSNSSDEDLHHMADYHNRVIRDTMLTKIETTCDRRIWGCSESSEGSDDSLPWIGNTVCCRSSVDSIDSPTLIPETIDDTREQRIQRYKEARRRENEARSRRVLEEDAKRRKARREENNNNKNNNNNNKNGEDDDRRVTITARINETMVIDDKPLGTSGETSDKIYLQKDRKVENDCVRAKSIETMKKSMITCNGTKRTMTNGQGNVTTIGVTSSNNGETMKSSRTKNKSTATASTTIDPFVRAAETVDAITRRLPPLKVSLETSQAIVRFMESNGGLRRQDNKNNNNNSSSSVSTNNNNNKSTNSNNRNNSSSSSSNNRETSTRYKVESPPSPGVVRTDSGERRSRARERRNVRDRCQISLFNNQTNGDNLKTTFLQDRRERLSLASRIIPNVSEKILRTSSNSRLTEKMTFFNDKKDFSCIVRERRERDAISLPRKTTTTMTAAAAAPLLLSIHAVNSSLTSTSMCEEDVAKLLAKCQRIDHYVPVREKLTLFESLSRLGGRLARSTEDLGRTSSKPSPQGKQRARSLHDLNRAARSLPVREMCRFFEGDRAETVNSTDCTVIIGKLSEITDSSKFGQNCSREFDMPASILKNSKNRDNHCRQESSSCVRMSSKRK